MEEQRSGELEEYGIVLDYLPTGKSFSTRSEPIAQLVGESKFTLLEAICKPGAQVKVEDRVYIGKAERDKIEMIKARLTYDELTEGSKKELPTAVLRIIKENEKKFVEVFNVAGPLNIREHSLELFPGIGKKHLKALLEAREQKKFESFADITARVPLMQDPAKMLADRAILELKGESRFYILTKPYQRERRF